ncbi:MAG: hypothetical protein ACREV9_12725 [Burkholderiales bacterium]
MVAVLWDARPPLLVEQREAKSTGSVSFRQNVLLADWRHLQITMKHQRYGANVCIQRRRDPLQASVSPLAARKRRDINPTLRLTCTLTTQPFDKFIVAATSVDDYSCL